MISDREKENLKLIVQGAYVISNEHGEYFEGFTEDMYKCKWQMYAVKAMVFTTKTLAEVTIITIRTLGYNGVLSVVYTGK